MQNSVADNGRDGLMPQVLLWHRTGNDNIMLPAADCVANGFSQYTATNNLSSYCNQVSSPTVALTGDARPQSSLGLRFLSESSTTTSSGSSEVFKQGLQGELNVVRGGRRPTKCFSPSQRPRRRLASVLTTCDEERFDEQAALPPQVKLPKPRGRASSSPLLPSRLSQPLRHSTTEKFENGVKMVTDSTDGHCVRTEVPPLLPTRPEQDHIQRAYRFSRTRRHSFTAAVTPNIVPDQRYSFIIQPVFSPDHGERGFSRESLLAVECDSSEVPSSPEEVNEGLVQTWRCSGVSPPAVEGKSPVYASIKLFHRSLRMSKRNPSTQPQSEEPDSSSLTADRLTHLDGTVDGMEMLPSVIRSPDDVQRSSLVHAVHNEVVQSEENHQEHKLVPSFSLLYQEGPVKFFEVFFSWLVSWPIDGERGRLLTRVLLCVLAWGTVATIVGKEGTSGGYLFALCVIIAFAALGGYLVRLIRLPPLLGMLLMGFALRNISGISVGSDLKSSWSSALRSVALVVILLRAGLGLDPSVLKRAKFVILRLAFLPCLFEASVDAALAVGILDMPWTWGFVLGFVIAAVSPAVVVPQLLLLQERGYGLVKGVPTLIIAAASFDDVLAISGFGIALGLIFSEGSLAFNIARGPLELITGILGGALVGIVAWFLPGYDRSKSHLHRNRVIFLLLAGLTAVFGTRRFHFTGAGALGVLTMAFVAGRKWLPDDKKAVAHSMALLWDFAQPMLFGLIGAEIKSSSLTESYVGKAIGVLWLGMAVRVTVSFFSVFGYGLNLKEKAFVALAWLPKATVQAAVGSIAYDTAVREKGTAEEKKLGLMVLTIAVLVIVITAPIGSVAIFLAGPRLLEKSDDEGHGQGGAQSPDGVTRPAANGYRQPLDARTSADTLLVTGV